MGWSCSGRASDSHDAVMAARAESDQYGAAESLAAGGYGRNVSNGWIDDSGRRCFMEIGREQEDGAITFQVFRHTSGNSCRRAGGGRIDKHGVIIRWPLACANMRAEIERINERARKAQDREQRAQAEFWRILTAGGSDAEAGAAYQAIHTGGAS